MLVTYDFHPNSEEWFEFRDAMMARGHVPVIRYKRVTPSSVAQVLPMGDYYISHKGEKCWPWVRFAGSIYSGYVLEGVDPLPVAPPAVKPMRVRSTKPMSRSGLAARWMGLHPNRTQKEAAEKYGISGAALSAALKKLPPIPRGRNDSKGAKAIRWAARYPTLTRYDIARLFGLSYETICKAYRQQGIYKPPATRDRTNEEIAILKRKLKL